MTSGWDYDKYKNTEMGSSRPVRGQGLTRGRWYYLQTISPTVISLLTTIQTQYSHESSLGDIQRQIPELSGIQVQFLYSSTLHLYVEKVISSGNS